MVAVALAIVPLYHLITSIAKGEGLGWILYYLAAIVGAGAAAYALSTSRERPGATSCYVWP